MHIVIGIIIGVLGTLAYLFKRVFTDFKIGL